MAMIQGVAQLKAYKRKVVDQRFSALLTAHSIRGWIRLYPLTGVPEFWFPKKRITVVVEDCVQCPWGYTQPKINERAWIGRSTNTRKYYWTTVKIMEHSLQQPEHRQAIVDHIKFLLKGASNGKRVRR